MVVSGSLQIIVMLLEWQPKAFTSFGDHVKEHMEPVKKYIENTWNMWRSTLKNYMEHVKEDLLVIATFSLVHAVYVDHEMCSS